MHAFWYSTVKRRTFTNNTESHYCVLLSHVMQALGLKRNKSMTALDVAYNNIGAEGADHIADYIRTSITITSLDISQNEIGEKGAGCVAVASCLPGLQIISHARYMATALCSNKSLTHLNLEGNAGVTSLIIRVEPLLN